MNDLPERGGRCLRVLGVAEPDPPCYPWRALRRVGLAATATETSADGYATATEKVMNEFGLTFAAAFAHVANCNQRRPEYSRYGSVGTRVQHEAVDRRWLDDRLPAAPTGAAEGIPVERTNGFASLRHPLDEDGLGRMVALLAPEAIARHLGRP